MASSSEKKPVSLLFVSAIAVAGACLLAIPFLFPNKSSTSSVEPTPLPVSENVNAPSPSSSSVPSSSSDSPAPVETTSPINTDPLRLINTGLAGYQETLQATGGVTGTLVTADSKGVELSLAPNGDYRALTGLATAPEWISVSGKLYARLGEKELQDQQAGLVAIGKPDAQWTDAAVGADNEQLMLSAGNIANAVADLVPLMDDIIVVRGENNAQVVQGTIDLSNVGTVGAAYGLTGITGTEPAKVSFIVDSSGKLTGYQVSPPGGRQAVSFLISQFLPVSLTAPTVELVVTLEDLARAAAPTGTTAPPAVTPVPTPAPS